MFNDFKFDFDTFVVGSLSVRFCQAANPRSHAIFRKMYQRALNCVLTLPDYRSRRELLKSSGFLDLQNELKHFGVKTMTMTYIKLIKLRG